MTRSPAELRNMFGQNLRKLSSEYASISELSRRLGINRTQFNRYLSGESFPRPDVLERICSFFEVDARVLLEPVDHLATSDPVMNSPFLSDFLGSSVRDLSEDDFPSGFYRFSRRSFVRSDSFVVGLVHIRRQNSTTFVRGFEAREAVREQGLRSDARAREFRGYVARQEDGITLTISRRNAMTGSFNYLARVASFENNFWCGYVTRTVRENAAGTRAERMVYEFLGPKIGPAVAAARKSGYCGSENLPPFHRQLLRPQDPFD